MSLCKEVLNWQRFFVAAGIPGAVALKYSKSFAEQRMKFTMLKELDKSVLMDLGVTTVGDQSMRVSEKKNISTAPDRDDIYHIHLPAGTTPKTQAILQKHNMLKSAGLLKRGSSGVRRSGKEIVRIPSHNNKWNHSNMARKTSKDVNMVDSSGKY
uniref:SAM domain-containing protein n=1 Tax=Thelazia callipaeda TaxID=103827 RepID=A0A0N5CN31_THECL